jgi:opacity protein-like surface antigen
MRLMPPIVCASVLLMSATASADDLLGIYVGAGAGQSQLQQNYYQVDSHTTGWKLVAGWRPISSLGVELDYADLGKKNVGYFGSFGVTQVSTKAHATSAYAVGYLPVPVPWLSIYGKLGATRVQADTNGSNTPGGCPVSLAPCGPNYFSTDTTSTKFAWGAGAEFKFGLPGLRVEYERLNGPQGDNALLSVAVTLNF